MSDKRTRDLDRLFATTAAECGAQYLGIEPTHGGHLRASFAKGNAKRFMIVAVSPRNAWRGKKNNTALARRLLRDIAA